MLLDEIATEVEDCTQCPKECKGSQCTTQASKQMLKDTCSNARNKNVRTRKHDTTSLPPPTPPTARSFPARSPRSVIFCGAQEPSVGLDRVLVVFQSTTTQALIKGFWKVWGWGLLVPLIQGRQGNKSKRDPSTTRYLQFFGGASFFKKTCTV